MKNSSRQAGFTLVELAIVMTIIGLLIGGILKGQELMRNARLTATIAQARSYEAAITGFRDATGSLPGDLRNAGNRLPGCTTACSPPVATAGNSFIGDPAWAENDWDSQAVTLAATNTDVGSETLLFWLHMLQFGLISGVSSETMNGAAMSWGVTHPASRLNGGFIVGYANGQNVTPGGTTGGVRPNGLFIAIVSSPTDDLNETPGVKPLQAKQVAQLDRKMDDGRPSAGFVQAYGVEATCFSGAALVYAENSMGQDCGAIIRVQ